MSGNKITAYAMVAALLAIIIYYGATLFAGAA